MRRITIWLLSTVAALVLLFTYRTSTNGSATAAPTTVQAPTGTPSTSAGSSGSKTYDGSVASTRWGDIQVTITVANGKITDVQVPVYPSANGRDREINSYALPVLRQEVLSAQSANIDTVSGATVTSDGYVESLQAALDAAHLS
jgi:uncharacterized protein with FMN-binding domain